MKDKFKRMKLELLTWKTNLLSLCLNGKEKRLLTIPLRIKLKNFQSNYRDLIDLQRKLIVEASN